MNKEFHALTHQTLGKTGIKISPLGLGTVKLGRDQAIKYPWKFTIPDDQRVLELLSLTHDLGINVIDTAPAYGDSQQRLGKLLKQRQQWVIVSKVGEKFTNGVSSFDFSGQSAIQSIEQSLHELKTDYIDIILIHSDGNDRQIIEQTNLIEALVKMKNEGKIRAFGLSSKTLWGGLWSVEQADVVMATRNLQDNSDEQVLNRSLETGAGVLIKKGLLSGHADKKAGGAGIEQAIKYVFNHAAVNCLLTGTINLQHLIENYRAVLGAVELSSN